MQGKAVSIDRPRAILESAIRVFGSLGFQKSSMADVAEAAGISKPGLYLHFTGKQQLFEAALAQYLDDRLADVRAALATSGAPLEARLAAALDAWFGSHLATFSPIAFDVIEAGNRNRKAEVDGYKFALKDALAQAVLREGASPKRARDCVDVLFLCGLTWKEPGTTPDSFRKAMASVIRVCSAAAAGGWT
jgi:AcrR family transcriptional regulator